jgi:molybdopterin converting factor small subunit/TusA-related sulfurtransferase
VGVRVRLFAAVREAAGTAEAAVAPAPLATLLDGLVARFGPEFARRLAISTVLVDGDVTPHSATTPVADGAEVAILPPVSGGAAAPDSSDEHWVERRPEVSVARALGSATRAGIYEHLQRHDDGVSVRDIADTFGLHPNVARTHLETLADAGLVVVGQRRRAAGGRPAKLYRSRGDAGAVRAEPALAGDGAGVLVEVLAGLAESAAAGAPSDLPVAAYEVAHVEGRRLGALARRAGTAHEELEAAATEVVATLSQHLPGVRLLRADDGVVDVTAPQGTFASLRERRPHLAAAVERGLLAGAVAVLAGPVDLAPGESLPDGTAVWCIRRAVRAREQVVPIAQVDTRGEHRDAGVVRAMRAASTLDPGAILEVLAEGPGSPAAFARWIDRAGHELLAVERVENAGGRRAIRLLIRKGD